jgi:hypothetical protein
MLNPPENERIEWSKELRSLHVTIARSINTLFLSACATILFYLFYTHFSGTPQSHSLILGVFSITGYLFYREWLDNAKRTSFAKTASSNALAVNGQD